MSYTFMYLFTRLDIIHKMSAMLLPASLFSIGVLVVIILDFGILTLEDYRRDWRKKYVNLMIMCASMSFLSLILVPTQKDAAAIYLIPKIVNSEKTQNIAENSLSLIEAKLSEWLKEVEGRRND